MKREQAEQIALSIKFDPMDPQGMHNRFVNAIMEAVAEATAGLKPEVPPRPPEGDGLPRYGLRWNGPTEPLPVPMADGYWTPWHLAERYRARLETAGHAHLDGAHWREKVDGCLLCDAMTERETLRARVAELEAARGEPVAYLHQVVCGDGEPDQALSFAPDNFPLAGILGYRSLSHEPLFRAPLNNELCGLVDDRRRACVY